VADDFATDTASVDAVLAEFEAAIPSMSASVQANAQANLADLEGTLQQDNATVQATGSADATAISGVVDGQVENLQQVLASLVSGAASVSTTSASGNIEVSGSLVSLLNELGLNMSGNVTVSGTDTSSGTTDTSSSPAPGSGTTNVSGSYSGTGNVLGILGSLQSQASATASGSMNHAADSSNGIWLSSATVSLLTSLGLNVASAS
jgi:hypothetical protein